MWQIANNELPKCITDLFYNRHKTNRPKRNMIFGRNFIPICRTTYKERFITNIGIEVWNEIPNKIKNKHNLNLFTKHYQEYLLKN